MKTAFFVLLVTAAFCGSILGAEAEPTESQKTQPHEIGQRAELEVREGSLQIRSAGPDLRFGTADDKMLKP